MVKSFLTSKRFTTGQVAGLLAAVFSGITVLAYAGVTVPHSFTADTTAKASEVNANFQAIADAINNRSTATLSTMAGTWKYVINGTYLNPSSGNTLCTYARTGVLTLNADGTLSDTQDDTYNYCHGTGAVTNTGGTYTGTWTVADDGSGTLNYPSTSGVSFRTSKSLDTMIGKWSFDTSTGSITYLRQ